MKGVCAFKELPARPNLEQYKKQAKDLLKRFQAGDSEVMSRVSQYHPHFRKVAEYAARGATFALADAQWVIAREHGFESWPKFAMHVEGAIDPSRGAVKTAAVVDVQLEITTEEIHRCAFARDGPVRVVEAESGQLEHILTGHRGYVRCLDVSRNVDRVLSGSGIRDPRVRLWDVASERCLQILEGHTDGIYHVALDVEQRRALSGSRDATVRVWDLESGRCLQVLEGHTYHVHSVVWGADGRRALSSSRDIRLWDVETGRCLRVFEGHTDTIRSVAWSADQRRALSGSHDGTVRIWDVETGTCLRTLDGHSVGVVNAVWSADGRGAFSCDWSGSIRSWDLSGNDE